jgi:hypothetical protein
MKYYVCSFGSKGIEILKVFENLNDAYGGAIKCIKKKIKGVEIVPVPQIRTGCSVFKSDGCYYGTIVSVSDSIISIASNNDCGIIPDPFIKDKFERLLIKGTFMLVDGVDIHNCEEMLELLNNIRSDIYDIRKRLDYVGAQQISFFNS